ncbi:L-lactate dehydrogenase [Clostridium sp. A1-XYC3]|uniref:L-lactate dehydrogenase n=1 Tax=Clostridium tanneri TaxID=3037988 RepID=A0ABU4JX03_9CLOT|nr:NAD(P)-binding domain-containing protein [Clostridium sp. A1-XYC3]MDW8802672.1 L-lactate dehydrogenase [Clostridium sp. A1-XYC3]
MIREGNKITIIGAGTIGSTVAYTLMLKGLAREIILINRTEGRARVKALDLAHCRTCTTETDIRSGDFEDSFNSDIVIIAGGALPRKDGTRMDVLENNINMYKDIIPKLVKYSPESVIIVVTNPVDIMAYVAYKLSGFPHSRIIGSGTLLDTLRFKYILSERFGIEASKIQAEIIGEHGDSMVPVWSRTRYLGTDLQQYLSTRKLILDYKGREEILEETKRAGWNIRLGNEHSCYAISSSIVKIIENILSFAEDMLPISTLLTGEYDIKKVFLSLPSFLHKKGVSEIGIINLDNEELKQLAQSAKVLTEYIREADSLLMHKL